MGAIEKLLNVALAEVGYLEKRSNSNLYNKTANAGSANYTKYGYEMHKLQPSNMDYPAPWCDAFVDWCFAQAFGVDTARVLLHGYDDYTVLSAQYFKNNKQWHTSPKVGDQIFFKNGSGICHTGLVYKVDSAYVYTIEGNTSSASGVVANGGAVAKKKYGLGFAKIAGYGRPDYSIVESEELTMAQYEELKKAIEAVSKENAQLNELTKTVADLQTKVNEVANPMIYNYIDDNMPAWARPTVTKLVTRGWLQGDENGHLNLDDSMLRILVINDRAGMYDKE